MTNPVPTIKLTEPDNNKLYFFIKRNDASKDTFRKFTKIFEKNDFEPITTSSGYIDVGLIKSFEDAAFKALSRDERQAYRENLEKTMHDDWIVVSILKHHPTDADHTPEKTLGYNIWEQYERIVEFAKPFFGNLRIDETSRELAQRLHDQVYNGLPERIDPRNPTKKLRKVPPQTEEKAKLYNPQILGANRFIEALDAQAKADVKAKDKVGANTNANTGARAAAIAASIARGETGNKADNAVSSDDDNEEDGHVEDADEPAAAAAAAADTVDVEQPDASEKPTIALRYEIRPSTKMPVYVLPVDAFSQDDCIALRNALGDKGLTVVNADADENKVFGTKQALLVKIHKLQKGEPGYTEISTGNTILEAYQKIKDVLGDTLQVNPNFIKTLVAVQQSDGAKNNVSLHGLDTLIQELNPQQPAANAANEAAGEKPLEAPKPAGAGVGGKTTLAEGSEKAADEQPEQGFFGKLCSIITTPFTWLWSGLKSVWKAIFG
jgi:hypothetical protein